jgi:hypothetical protein
MWTRGSRGRSFGPLWVRSADVERHECRSINVMYLRLRQPELPNELRDIVGDLAVIHLWIEHAACTSLWSDEMVYRTHQLCSGSWEMGSPKRGGWVALINSQGQLEMSNSYQCEAVRRALRYIGSESHLPAHSRVSSWAGRRSKGCISLVAKLA